MQVLNSSPSQSSHSLPTQLWVSLQNIVDKVQIESNFCIRHPDYQPWELPTEAVKQLQQLPLPSQRRCLGARLRSFLYRTYYNGSIQTTAGADDEVVQQDLENDTFLGVNQAFYDQLHGNNSGEGYFDPDWQVLSEESDGSLKVNKDGLTLYAERDRHLLPAARAATIGDIIAIRLPKNLLQSRFYMAVGNAGRNNDTSKLVRVYFNLSPEGAVRVMGSLTQQLNGFSLPFSFKVLYNPPDYKRYDSGVLYFYKSDYDLVRSALQTVYAQHQPYFQQPEPLFTKLLAPGLSLAEEPNNQSSERESFGLNRCQIVAQGLLDAWYKGDNSPQGRMNSISQRFSMLGIELQRPYLNRNSDDIYTPLEL